MPFSRIILFMPCAFFDVRAVDARSYDIQSQRPDLGQSVVEREVVEMDDTALIVALQQDNGGESSLRTHCEDTLLTTLAGCKSAEFLKELDLCILAFHDYDSALAARDTTNMSPLTAASDLTGRSLAEVPNDTRHNQQWSAADVDRPEAWDNVSGDSSSPRVVVAVVDTGVDYTHPDLKDHMWQGETKGGYDMVANTNDPMDSDGHGTHCAGIMVTRTNNKRRGVIGASSSGVQIMALKVVDHKGSFRNEAIYKATNRMLEHEVRLSSHSYYASSNSYFFRRVAQAMQNKNHLMIIAAGNRGKNLEHEAAYPCCLASPNIVCVAALKNNFVMWEESNYGKTCVDVAAPGENIHSTRRGGGYEYRTGTSFATPIVAGFTAWTLMRRSNLTSTALKQTIQSSVIPDARLKDKVKWSGRINDKLLTPIVPEAKPQLPIIIVIPIIMVIAVVLLVVIAIALQYSSRNTTKIGTTVQMTGSLPGPDVERMDVETSYFE